jgi:hypothetical protein
MLYLYVHHARPSYRRAEMFLTAFAYPKTAQVRDGCTVLVASQIGGELSLAASAGCLDIVRLRITIGWVWR